MKNSFISIALIMILLLACFSCSGDTGNNTSNKSTDITPNTPQTDNNKVPGSSENGLLTEVDLNLTDDLPEIDYGGYEFKIFVPAPNGVNRYFIESISSDSTVIDTAVYNRNLEISDRFNVKITSFDNSVSTDDHARRITESVQSSDYAFDIACVHSAQSCASLIMAGSIMPFNDFDYIDFDKPWWSQNIIDTCSIFDNIYFISGAMNWGTYIRSSCVLFNKKLAEEYDLPNLYELVKSGEWTMDKVYELTENFSEDLNQDGLYNFDDRLAVISDNTTFLNYFMGTLRLSTAKKGEADMPVVVAGDERMQLAVEKVYNLFYDGNRGYIYPNAHRKDPTPYMFNAFMEDKVLFNFCDINSATLLRDMDVDFGILPYPKLDEMQEQYSTQTDPWGLVTCVPLYCDNKERTGLILEAMSAGAYKTIIPVLYDTLIIGITTRDEESKEMIKLIFDNVYYDFGYLYDGNGSGYAGIMKEMINARTTDLQSYIAASKDRAEQHYTELYEAAIEQYGT